VEDSATPRMAASRTPFYTQAPGAGGSAELPPVHGIDDAWNGLRDHARGLKDRARQCHTASFGLAEATGLSLSWG
jgi:hypothetical protein